MKEKYIKRLADEWIQHGKIIIAVDFDDTVSPWRFTDAESREFYRKLILDLKRWKYFGMYLVVFTACNPDRYPEIRKFFSDNNLHVDSINETPIDTIPYGATGSKVYANVYLDDRAGLNEAIEIIERALALKAYATETPLTEIA